MLNIGTMPEAEFYPYKIVTYPLMMLWCAFNIVCTLFAIITLPFWSMVVWALSPWLKPK